MFCSECGASVNDDAKFCGECGAAQLNSEQPLKEHAANANLTSNAISSSGNDPLAYFKAIGAVIFLIVGFLVVSHYATDTESERAAKEYETRVSKAAEVGEKASIEARAVAKKSADIERQKAVKAAVCQLNVARSIESYLYENGRISPAIDIIGFTIQAERMQSGFDVDRQSTNFDKNVVKTSSASYEGRHVTACLEHVELSLVNRSAGKRGSVCFDTAYLADNEFSMSRNIKVMDCAETQSKLPSWSQENNVSNF